jgi:hypothetical protein
MGHERDGTLPTQLDEVALRRGSGRRERAQPLCEDAPDADPDQRIGEPTGLGERRLRGQLDLLGGRLGRD